MRTKLVRESLNEEQEAFGDKYERIYRDSKSDWPEADDTSDIDEEWYEKFIEALHNEFPNEDDENLYMLLDILDTVEDQVQPKALFDLGYSPEKAADLIANSEEALDMWHNAITDEQEVDGNTGEEDSAPR